MGLKVEFDGSSSRSVIIRGLVGAILGLVPGMIYVLSAKQNLNEQPFALMLFQTGCLAGVIIAVSSSAIGHLVAAARRRGSSSVKSERLKEYLNPEPIPSAPGATITREKVGGIKQGPDAPIKPISVKAIESPASPSSGPAQAQAPTEPTFEDYDRQQMAALEST